MAEAIAAFSLASNVLQFVDFGSKVAARFHDFYHSSRHGEIIPDVGSHLVLIQNILANLATEDDDGRDAPSPFRLLADQCSEIAKELLAIFKSLDGTKSNTAESKASALRMAFKLIWKDDDITKLGLRLNHLRSQLILQLVSESR